jgi:hypothetical protein
MHLNLHKPFKIRFDLTKEFWGLYWFQMPAVLSPLA